jgi:hypothetical protein
MLIKIDDDVDRSVNALSFEDEGGLFVVVGRKIAP